MKTDLECIIDLFGKVPSKDSILCLPVSEVCRLMNHYLDQFYYIKTRCGKSVIFYSCDYSFLNTISITINNSGLAYRHKGRYLILANILLKARKHDVVEYIDGNIFNLKRSNIYLSSRSKIHLTRNKSKANSSGYMGVSRRKGTYKFESYVQFNGKRIHFGFFYSAKEAAIAYNVGCIKLFGSEFKKLNVI